MSEAASRRRRAAGLTVAAVVLLALVAFVLTRGGSGNHPADDALGSTPAQASATATATPSAAPKPTPTRTASSTAAASGGGDTTSTSGGGAAAVALPAGGPTYTPQSAPPPTTSPGTAALRLALLKTNPYLTPPGLAMDRGTIRLTPASPLDFDTDPLSRSVDVAGAPTLRLHLTHDGSGDIPLTLSLLDVAPDGSAATLATKAFTVPAATAAAGPASNADAAFGTVHHRFAAQHVLRLRVALDSLVDNVTIYYGALPGEADGNSNQDQLTRAQGGANPTRLNVPVSRIQGAFAP